MNKTNIEWCDYTWNPVTGCKRNCIYCYARRIHNRFNDYPFATIVHHIKRMHEPTKHKKPVTIFVGSMSDIQYWHPDILEDVLEECRNNPQHTFMFLSKDPLSYMGFTWPANTMQGLTLEKLSFSDFHKVFHFLEVTKRPFISLEPLLGPVIWSTDFNKIEKVIVGAMTGPGAFKPNQEWIDSVRESIPAEKIFWKKNILNKLN